MLTLEIQDDYVRVKTDADELLATFGKPKNAAANWWQGPLSSMLFEHQGQFWGWRGNEFVPVESQEGVPD
jgi:hypothetical protein